MTTLTAVIDAAETAGENVAEKLVPLDGVAGGLAERGARGPGEGDLVRLAVAGRGQTRDGDGPE